VLKRPRTIAILEVMWDWNAQTSAVNPNYLAEAPRAFRINPQNHSGKRLYKLIGHKNLLVTNACPELVSSAKGEGNPDVEWLKESLRGLAPYELLLVCGKVAQKTYDQVYGGHAARTLYIPHPAARQWTARDLQFAQSIIQQGIHSLELKFKSGRLRAVSLAPF
jgi:hypothetical protein